KKWETFYGEEALGWQKRFLDQFLKGIENSMDRMPKVRLEVRRAFYQQAVRSEETWPPASVEGTTFYLCANTAGLQTEPAGSEGEMHYRSTARHERAVFSYKFEQLAELIGSMRLRVWVRTSEGDDLDVFVVLSKLDRTGSEVFFSGFNGYQRDSVAK